MTPSPKQQFAIVRHERDCRVCRHPKREEIELDFVSWKSPQQIAKRNGVSARAVYRHAQVFGLFARRNRNVRAALGIIIEQVSKVRVTAPTVVSAIAVLSKINANGQWIDRRETVSLNSLFERMSQGELEKYARDGTLPQWFEHSVSAPYLQAPAGEDG